MKVDADWWLLTIFGSALVAAGGALVRSAFYRPMMVPGPGPEIEPPYPSRAPPPAAGVGSAPVSGESDLAALREELAKANTAREAQRTEMVEQRQRSERQVQGAQAEIQRLAAELDTEKLRSHAGEEAAAEMRSRLATAEEELKRAKAAPADTKAIAIAQGQVADLQKKLKTVAEERDSARAKVEALERLVEGVRARSRELADEVKALKENSGAKEK
ncbi:MAG TPA: hypothetical protein VJT73_15570 [Polyangiaceae bacterium]|nr:hypothetical protein [Polyangiaceae bacterium]